MAEDADSKSRLRGRSFLSKSKWGKVFKENDAPPIPGNATNAAKVNSFKLNEDVVDFLKPSTEKSKPKLDIAIAQRWPAAHEVRQASQDNVPTGQTDLPAGVPQWTGYRKRRRREGLIVGFVKTAPDIIGEGGDEAPDPPAEVSRQRASVSRSVSARQPGALDDGAPWPGAPTSRPTSRQAGRPVNEDEFRPPPVRRADTSHNEFSPPVQRKFASPPLEPVSHRPSLGRTPTGFGELAKAPHHDMADYESDEEQVPPVPNGPPTLDTKVPQIGEGWQFDSPQPMTGSTTSSKRSQMPINDPTSPVMVRRRDRDMQASEGMVLRRASTLLMQDEEPQSRRQELSTGILPSPQFYNTLSNLPANNIAQDSDATEQAQPPAGSTLSPHRPERSPFDDPKYVERSSTDTARHPPAQASRPARSTYDVLDQQARQAPPPTSQPAPGGHRATRSKDFTPPSYMRSAQPSAPAPGPSHDPPHQRSVDDDRPSHIRAGQLFPQTQLPISPAPVSAQQTMQVPSEESRTRSRSPMRDRIFDSNASPSKPRPFYSQANHSSGSINRFPARPGSSHSRTSSRGEASPQIRQPATSSPQSPQTVPTQVQKQNPHSSTLR